MKCQNGMTRCQLTDASLNVKIAVTNTAHTYDIMSKYIYDIKMMLFD